MGRATYDLHGDDLGHSWADDSTNYYAQAQSVLPMPPFNVQQSQHMMEKKESRVAQDWATNGASPARANYSGGAMMSKVEHGWANKPNPTQASGYGASMYKGQEANKYQYARSGSASGGWANKPTGFSGPNQVNQSTQMIYGQHEQQGRWANSPTTFPSSAQANHSSLAMHKEEQMMEKMDHGWAPSPTKANHSSFAMRKEDHMVGKMDQGWAASPTIANLSSQTMHNDEHVMGQMDHGWVASPTKANLSSLSMRKEEHMMGKMDQGWVASPTTKTSHSSHAMMHKEEHNMGQTRSLSMGPNHVDNHSGHGMYKDQGRQGWAGKHGNSFGAGQINHSAHATCNHDECEDEGVDDILDEILTKYPAHNVSSGHANWATKPNSSMSQSQASSYAKQQAWAQSAHHGGGGAQSSMAWGERKEKKEAYSSASSNVGKFGMSGAMSNGGTYVGSIGGVGNHSYRDCDD